MNYAITKEDILARVSSKAFAGYLDSDTEFHGPVGKEHYKLLSYLSTLVSNSVIIDIGTHRGSSALALSYNSSNTIHTFDIVDKVNNPHIKNRPNIQFHIADLFGTHGQDQWKHTILSAPFIVLDVDPHNGHMERQFYEWLKQIDYKGFVVCDDIWYFKEMRDNFWSTIPLNERYDLTELGHWSGTGILTFNSDISFTVGSKKASNSDWTLVTAYFDLTKCDDASTEIKKRDKAHYMNAARATMAVPYNLVVFCEEDNLELIKSMRPTHLQAQTHYIVREFDSFCFNSDSNSSSETQTQTQTQPQQTFADYRVKIAENRKNHPYSFDNRNTPSYYLFCMARYSMLKEIISANPFNSTHFGWINFCMERMGYKNLMYLDAALSVHRDRFSTCYIDYIPEHLVQNTAEYYKWGRCGMCSGFFTGSAEYMFKVCDLIERKFLKYLDEGYGHADEQLYSPVYFENPDLFEHYYGDYQQMITNYVSVREAAEPPIYNFIRNSFKHGNFVKCRNACEFVIRSVQSGHCSCNPALLLEAEQTFAKCW